MFTQAWKITASLTLCAGLLPCAGLAPTARADIDPPFDVPWVGYDTSVYPQGYLPWAARTADFNRDGRMDLAVCSWYSNSRLTILLGDGEGGFAPPVYYTLPMGALDLEVGDFDRDGDLDLVVSHAGQFWEGQSFSLFRNNGSGAFVEQRYFLSEAGPTGLAAGDFDGDGWLDVAFAHDAYIVSNNKVTVVFNDRGGGFGAEQVYTIASGTYKLAAGDVDRDGDVDLVVAHETDRISVMRNSAGRFDDTTTYPSIDTSYFCLYPAATLADVDNDGDLDILYSSFGTGGNLTGALALYRNDGAGRFASPERVALGAQINGAIDIAVADLTGDGWPDIAATTETTHKWALVASDGRGGFTAARQLRAGEAPIAVELADLDGDGRLDVIVVARDSLEACVYLNPGGGQFVQPPVIDMVDQSLAPVSYSNLAWGDIDGDGDVDLAVGFSANFLDQFGISVRRNNGDGTFAEPQIYARSVFPVRLHLLDMNNDGRPDLLLAPEGWPPIFVVKLNNGDGTFGREIVGPRGYDDISAIGAWDFDNDGDLDVVMNVYYNEVGISLNLGDSFAPLRYHTVTTTVSAVAAADFNADGKLDLLTNSGVQGYPEISLGNGDGTFQSAYTLQTGRSVIAMAGADVNGNGRLDLLVNYNLDGKGMSVRLGRGDGNFLAPRSYHGSTSARVDNQPSLVVADVDGDGALDVLCANYGSQDVSFWRGRGDGTFDELRRYGVGQQAADVAWADFDGDRVGDLAVLCGPDSPGSGWYYPGIVLLRGAGGGKPGDLNGDGRVDQVDLAILLADWGCTGGNCPGDADGDGDTDQADLAVLLAHFGT
jgi:hypothetical protein